MVSATGSRPTRLTLHLPDPGAKLGLWRDSCDQMLESLEGFSQKLLSNVETFRKHGDKNGAYILSSSCIASLSHLAVLYEVTGQTDPAAKAQMDHSCDLSLQRLGELTSELQPDEYSYLDLLLGVCLTLCHPLSTAN
jgi:hypothetical protein